MPDVVSSFEMVKDEDIGLLKTKVNDLIKQGWTPWKMGQETYGTPEIWCALLKYSGLPSIVLQEIPKIETALNFFKTDTTAGSLGIQLKALTDSVAAITSLNLGNATVTSELGKISAAIASATALVNTQRNAITASKEAIKTAK